MSKNIIVSIGKCFLYVVLFGICQACLLSVIPNDILLGTLFSSIMFICLVFAIARIFKWELSDRLGIRRISIRNILFIICLAIIVNFAIQSVQLLFPESMRSDMVSSLESDFLNGKSLIGFLAVVIFAPMSEELLFRGLLFGELKKSTNTYIAGFLQAVLFGIMHGNIIWGLIAFLSAVFYAFLFERFNSIFAPLVGHMSVNLLAFILL